MIFIDAKDSVLGRLATFTAKKLLAGDDVIIFNAEKAIITGDKEVTAKKYMALRRLGSPQHGPFYPRKPEMIVKRSIRGMLPKNKKGRAALKKLRVYACVPDGGAKEPVRVAQKEVKSDYITIKELSRRLGWQSP